MMAVRTTVLNLKHDGVIRVNQFHAGASAGDTMSDLMVGARSVLRAAGFEVLRTDFLFIFQRLLRVLRPLESLAAKLPLGAQYQILCRRTD
jgi:hypothetical protein